MVECDQGGWFSDISRSFRLHKEHFACAYTAGEALAALETAFDDESHTLKVRQAAAGHEVSANLQAPEQVEETLCKMLRPVRQTALSILTFSHMRVVWQIASLESFMGESLGGCSVSLVRASGNISTHAFGNWQNLQTKETRLIHIVNAETCAEVSEKIGTNLDPLRFRANIILEGLPAWQEFEWVGSKIQIGTAKLNVYSKTIRCDAVNVDLATTKKDLDLPKLLAEHYPQHGPYLGVYAQVEAGGKIACGDTVARL